MILTIEQIFAVRRLRNWFACGTRTFKPNIKPTIAKEEGCFVQYMERIYFKLKELKYQLLGGKRYEPLKGLDKIVESQLVRYIHHITKNVIYFCLHSTH